MMVASLLETSMETGNPWMCESWAPTVLRNHRSSWRLIQKVAGEIWAPIFTSALVVKAGLSKQGKSWMCEIWNVIVYICIYDAHKAGTERVTTEPQKLLDTNAKGCC
jgi:hypothetical protein